jgi:hypothetical protein
MSCSQSERCYNKGRTCNVCTNREGYVESYDWFVDKADVEQMTNRNKTIKEAKE